MRWDRLNGIGIIRNPGWASNCVMCTPCPISWNTAPATSLHIPVQTPKQSTSGNKRRGAGSDQPWQAVTGAVDPAACAVKLSLTPPQSALLEPWNGFSISQTVSYQITKSIFKKGFASLNFVWVNKKWQSWRESKAHVFLERKKGQSTNMWPTGEQCNQDGFETCSRRMREGHGERRNKERSRQLSANLRLSPMSSTQLPSLTDAYLHAIERNSQIRPALNRDLVYFQQ